jgi:long-chain acyl-CoA synthetase
MYETRPWLKYYGDVPHTIDYPHKTMYEMVRDAAVEYPEAIAYDFMGTRSSYRGLLADIDRTADALASRGLKKGDAVTISLPNCPQAVILFYAVNKVGAIGNMIHPLSAPTEIAFYLKESKSVWAVTLDAFYSSFAKIVDNSCVTTLLLTKIGDYLSPVKRAGFYLTSGRKIAKPPKEERRILWWRELLSKPADARVGETPLRPEECAVILYSGGTTGTPKGIMLSSLNFNALGLQIAAQGPLVPRDTILSILPVFHGFGLGVCVHAFLIKAGKCVLVPRFTAETVAKLVRSEQPQYMAGVPTLYEALLRDPTMNRTSLACLKMVYAGGDKLPQSIKERFDLLIRARGGNSELLEGYGLTESVTACVATPKRNYRPGSIGIPISDMEAKVVTPGTTEEAQPGVDGELCIAGPTVMMGYLNSPEATAATLKRHADGRLWLHTGDVCSMDSDGFVYFKLRAKRIIKVSGVSVSPFKVEEILDAHPDVSMSCVIGIPDPYKMQALKAYVVLREGAQACPEKERELIDHCRTHLIKWSVPEKIEFRDSLPMTRIGKIAFSELEKEAGS